MAERRVRILKIRMQDMLDIIMGKFSFTLDCPDMPHGAEVYGVNFCPEEDTFLIKVSHISFAAIPEGEPYPRLNCWLSKPVSTPPEAPLLKNSLTPTPSYETFREEAVRHGFTGNQAAFLWNFLVYKSYLVHKP